MYGWYCANSEWPLQHNNGRRDAQERVRRGDRFEIRTFFIQTSKVPLSAAARCACANSTNASKWNKPYFISFLFLYEPRVFFVIFKGCLDKRLSKNVEHSQCFCKLTFCRYRSDFIEVLEVDNKMQAACSYQVAIDHCILVTEKKPRE